jgi:hypothetical protein
VSKAGQGAATASAADPTPARELIGCWHSTRFSVLVPRKRGKGFRRVPLGHHHDPKLDAVEEAANCNLFGLDGALEFECGGSIATYADRRAEFLRRVQPALEATYGVALRLVEQAEYWALHPDQPAS